MNSLFISPHSDDSVLFGAFTLMREKPLVLTVTDSFVQQNRGENITPDQRRQEDIEAMKLLGCPLVFGGIRDDIIDEWAIENLFSRFKNFDTVYIPAVIVPGNPHHNLIGEIAEKIFSHTVKYMTYSTRELYLKGSHEIKPTQKETKLKNLALASYKSQLALPATAPHFEAVIKGGSEWVM